MYHQHQAADLEDLPGIRRLAMLRSSRIECINIGSRTIHSSRKHMALSVIVDLAGIAVTTASILQSVIPSKIENNHASFRVRAALNGQYDDGTLSGAGGSAPDTRTFNEQLDFLGANYDPTYVGDGGYSDYTVAQGNTQEPTFALFTANDDAICIAYITVKYPSSMDSSWVGTWGKACDQPWYHSDVYYDGNKVDCTWIDANGKHLDIFKWPSRRLSLERY